MKQTLLIALLAVPLLAGAQSQLAGNWKETRRLAANGTLMPFSDTLKLDFLTGNEYLWQKGGSFQYRGTYKIVNDELDFGMARFHIAQKSNYRLLLQDEAGISYELAAYMPPVHSPAAKRQEVYQPVTGIAQMAGQWSVYKRTSAKPMDKVDYTRQIKKVDIFRQQQDGRWGYFFAGMDGDNNPSWYIEDFADKTLRLNGKDSRSFRVIKAQDGELILEENGITYFFKQF